MRALGTFVLLALLLGLSAGSASAAADPSPSCAQGPLTVGETTFGTPCGEMIVAPAGVAAVEGGGGDDTIVPAPIAAASAPCPSGCFLGVGSQTFDGGPGDDIVFGQRGNDTLRGGEGNDHLFGGIGDDLLRGGPGNDRLGGGFGADFIDGEGSDDYVHGDGTIDRIFDSGGGTDTLSYATGITPGFDGAVAAGFGDFPPADEGRGVKLDLGVLDPEKLNGNNGAASFGGGNDKVGGENFETVIGTPFADYIVGTAADQTIYGGGGGDVILGEGGNDTLEGGADGDYVNGGAADQRDPSKVSVGFMVAAQPGYAQLYATGSDSADSLTALYSAGPPATVTFQLAGSSFDRGAAAAAGCAVAANVATCTLTAPLDSLVLAGMDGADSIAAAGFPVTTTVVTLGGEDGDSLSGQGGDDVLVDGPGEGADQLSALGSDDALLHNGGADTLLGGDGNDLFLSVSICDDEEVVGGTGRDNSSWARLGEAVTANLGAGIAGRPGGGATPVCTGGTPDSLREIEDLEGSASADVFVGDAGPNQLLGHLGPDIYLAAAGADTILANSGDSDPVIDCGDDIDRALVDFPQYGDATPVNCEVVREAEPNSFQLLPGFPLPTPPPPAVVPPPPPPVRDRKPPQTKILARPPPLLTTHRGRRRVVLRFAASEPRSTFRCKLDRRPFVPCASPRSYALAPGRHTIRVRAVDPAGNADPTPALIKVRVRRR